MSEDKKAFANFITDPSATLRVSVQVAMTMVEWERFKKVLDKTCEDGTEEDFERVFNEYIGAGFADIARTHIFGVDVVEAPRDPKSPRWRMLD